MIKHLVLGLAIASAACAQAQTQTQTQTPFPGADTPLGSRIASLLHDDPSANRAHWGIAVTTVDGKPLFGLNEAQLFRPASNNKLFTTAAAMALLGPETRVNTIVTADAPPDADGLITGDIILHGVGDPSLSGRMYPYETPEQHKLRAAQENAALEARAKAACDKAVALEIAREKQAGEAQDEMAGREQAEACNSAKGDVYASTVPDEVKPMDDLAAQIAAAGVKKLTGAVRGDSSLWRSPTYAPSWDAGDAVWGYGAAVTALTFNDSQLEMTVRPGQNVGDKPFLQIVPNVDFTGLPINKATTLANAKEAIIDIAPRSFPGANIVIGGVAPGHPDTEEIAVQDPSLFAANVLMSRMHAHGITGGQGTRSEPPPQASALPTSLQIGQPVDLTPKSETETSPVCGREFTCGIVLAKHLSPTIAEDVTVTLKVSQNLHAEMFLRRLGRAYGTEGSFDQGTRVVRHWLTERAGLDGSDFAFYDGSGLSGHDLVAPRATAHLLAYAGTQPWFAQWKAALPVGGVDGSLEGRFAAPDLKGKVFAKTGTLGESRALSGYLIAASGRTVIFSVMVDTHAPYGSDDRTVMDDIVAAIAASE